MRYRIDDSYDSSKSEGPNRSRVCKIAGMLSNDAASGGGSSPLPGRAASTRRAACAEKGRENFGAPGSRFRINLARAKMLGGPPPNGQGVVPYPNFLHKGQKMFLSLMEEVRVGMNSVLRDTTSPRLKKMLKDYILHASAARG